MATGYTTVSASALADATGALIANATISFKPVDNKGNSISFRAGGTSEGQASSQPVSTTVTNGAFTIQLADTTMTTPVNVGYTVTVIDNLTGDCLLGPAGYICVQPSGATWSFDTYVPNFASQVTVQTGPAGKDGQGFRNRGAWAANTAYAAYDVLTYGDTTYLVSTAFTSGTAFDGSNLQPLMSVDVEPDGSVLTIQDKNDYSVTLYSTSNGKIVSNLYESRVAALETEIESVPASGGGYILAMADETGDYKLSIVDSNGNLTLPSTQSASVLSTAIATMSASCNAYSRAVAERFNLLGIGFDYDYNVVIMDGQSMMSGYQAVGVYSTAAHGYPKHSNKGLGQYADWTNGAGNGTPIGDNTIDPLVEGYPDGRPETPTSGAATMLKQWLNSTEHVLESGKTLVFTNIAVPGTTIDEHLPGAAGYPDSTYPNIWQRSINAFNYIKGAVPAGKTVGVVAICWGQGEFNVGDTEAAYTAKLVTLRAAYDALAVSVFGQTTPAAWFISQIGGGYISDGAPGVIQAQVNYPLTTPNTYCVGSYYHTPNLGNGHRTGNGFRWMGTQFGRVMGQVLAARRAYEPIHPVRTQWVGNTLLVGFHVPNGPLTARPSYNGATPENFADLGFNLYDAAGYIPCAVSIVSDSVVQLVPQSIVDQSTARLCYADQGGSSGSPPHYGMGNLSDSNRLGCEDIYFAPDMDSTVDGPTNPDNGAGTNVNYDIPGLTGLPYPQNNFCVAFQINPTTFNGSF